MRSLTIYPEIMEFHKPIYKDLTMFNRLTDLTHQTLGSYREMGSFIKTNTGKELQNCLKHIETP